jgi:hypothetical protein
MELAAPDHDMRLDLDREFRNDDEHETAVRILTGLVGRAEGSLAKGEREYADALSGLIREYDARVYPLPKRRSSPLALVKLLMDAHQESTVPHAIKPAQRNLQSWLIFGLLVGLHRMLAFLVWPGLLGNWAGSRKRW